MFKVGDRVKVISVIDNSKTHACQDNKYYNLILDIPVVITKISDSMYPWKKWVCLNNNTQPISINQIERIKKITKFIINDHSNRYRKIK